MNSFSKDELKTRLNSVLSLAQEVIELLESPEFDEKSFDDLEEVYEYLDEMRGDINVADDSVLRALKGK